jgi:4-azaleucine resistance transporter AzlC
MKRLMESDGWSESSAPRSLSAAMTVGAAAVLDHSRGRDGYAGLGMLDAGFFKAGDFRRGLVDILPILAAAFPIGLLWGALAVKTGLSPLEATLTSASTSAGAAQFVAVNLWHDPVPWLMVTFSVFVVNLRHVMMGASLSRHTTHIPENMRALAMFLMTDEVWALSERRVLSQPLTWSYYLGLGVPLWINWVVATVIGAIVGHSLSDPAIYGFDFAFAALYISILTGFWRGPQTGAVLAASAATAVLTKLLLPGAWYIAVGGLAGVAVAIMTETRNVMHGD